MVQTAECTEKGGKYCEIGCGVPVNNIYHVKTHFEWGVNGHQFKIGQCWMYVSEPSFFLKKQVWSCLFRTVICKQEGGFLISHLFCLLGTDFL